MRWRLVAVAVLLTAGLGAQTAHASVIQLQPNNIGLVGYWSFNEGTSTIAHDYSGHGNNGTLEGSTLPQWVPGKFGDALSFDGSTSYVDLGNNSAIKVPLPITVSAWVKLSNLATYYNVLATDGGPNLYAGVNMLVDTGGAIEIDYGDDGSGNSGNRRTINSTATITANQWYHIVGVIRGPTDMSIYIDGVDAGGSYSGSGGALAYTSNSGEINGDYWENTFLPGDIDEVRIYDRALTATEVAGLYQSGLAKINSSQSPGTLSQGLVGWWTMDGADTVWSSPTAGTEVDRSGNGNTGTLENMTQSGAPTVGKIGQALNFDGTDQYIDTNDFSSLGGATHASLSFWVKWNDGNVMIIRGVDGYRFGVEFFGSSYLSVVVEDGATSYPNTTYTTNYGQWVHFVMTYDGTQSGLDRVKLYADGQPLTLTAGGADPASSLTSGSPSYPFSIGLRYSGGVHYSELPTDDVRIYDRTLSQAKLHQLYNLGAGTHVNTSSVNLQRGSSVANGLVGYWTFDGSDISGSTIYDLSGNGNNGTNKAACRPLANWGRRSISMEVRRYISLPDVPALTPNFPFSVTFWVKPVSYDPSWQGSVVLPGQVGDEGVAVGITSSGGAWAQYGNSSDYYDQHSAATCALNSWCFVTAVFGGPYATEIYVNDSPSDGTTAGGASSLTYGSALGYLGQNYSSAGNQSLDDVRVYNRALSASEVQYLYNMGK